MMDNQALKAGRTDSLARRPAIAQGTAAPVGGNRQFDGRRTLKGGSSIKLDRIAPDPNQPRKTFPAEALGRLSENMRTRGQLVPILVRWSPEADRYVVIDGERRYRAATMAGLAEMACVVEDESDADTILEMQLIANALREDVAPVEQAKAWDRLRQTQGLSLRALGDKLGYDYSTVAKGLDLLKLAPEIQERVDAGDLPASTAGQLARLDHAEQVVVADRVAAEGLNRAEAGEVVRQVAARQPAGRGGASVSLSKGSGRDKPARDTSRVFKAGDGFRITAHRARGLDLAKLVEALESAAAEVRAELAGMSA